jgi:predicted metal-dependent hydrolase
MRENSRRGSPRKSKLAEHFEREGYTLEETEYEVLPARGAHVDLMRALRRVDRGYFGQSRAFDLPQVAWSPLDAHNAWAVYVLKDDRILLEKTLDDPLTPPYVIDYLLLHELLHLFHLPAEGAGEPEWHTDRFEEELAKFPRAREAEAWLERRLAEELRRKTGRSARGLRST